MGGGTGKGCFGCRPPIEEEYQDPAPAVLVNFLFLSMQIDRNWFRDWFNSPYYHLLYFRRNEQEAADFIHRLAGLLHPPEGSRMLDIACGRGRHAAILASLGYDVTGIDLAPDSIRHARMLEQEHLHFFVHDMRLPFRTNYFDYVFNFFSSFGYFSTYREHRNSIRWMSRSLRRGGHLLLDYLSVDQAEARMQPYSELNIHGVHFVIRKWSDASYLYKNIRVEDRHLPAPLSFTERLAKFRLNDFELLFSREGLRLEKVFGDYQLAPFRARQSDRLILLAVKNEG